MSRRETLGSRIRRLRTERLLGLRELARKVDISATYLSRIEGGKARTYAKDAGEGFIPSLAVLRRLAHALGDDADELARLAGKIPEDVETYLLQDTGLVKALRRAAQCAVTGAELELLIEGSRWDPSSTVSFRLTGDTRDSKT